MNFSKKLLNLIVISVLLIGVLGIANLIKFGFITKDAIVANKDFIDVLGNIATFIILVIGAGASYYRFFRGRIFSNNASIDIKISIHKINDDLLLHVIDVELKNEGSFPIWEPMPSLIAYPHGISELGKAFNIDFWTPEIKTSTRHTQVIDSQETEQFCAFHRVPKNILAITYVVQIKSRQNDKWTKTITISNTLKSSD